MSESLGENRDILGIAVDNSSPDSDGVVQTFFLRDGRLIGREHFYMTHVAGRKKSDILSEFIKQFYGGTPSIPKEIYLPCDLEDRDLLEQWLKDHPEISVLSKDESREKQKYRWFVSI